MWQSCLHKLCKSIFPLWDNRKKLAVFMKSHLATVIKRERTKTHVVLGFTHNTRLDAAFSGQKSNKSLTTVKKKIIHIRPTDFFVKRTSEQHVICQRYYDLFLYLLKEKEQSPGLSKQTAGITTPDAVQISRTAPRPPLDLQS